MQTNLDTDRETVTSARPKKKVFCCQQHLPTKPMRASPVLATSNPSPVPPPPPLGSISSRRSFASRAFNKPRWPLVALFFCVRAIWKQTKCFCYLTLTTNFTVFPKYFYNTNSNTLKFKHFISNYKKLRSNLCLAFVTALKENGDNHINNKI